MRKAIILFLVLMCAINVKAVPRLITYQGKLTGIDGLGIDDSVDLYFNICDDSVAGSYLWNESHLNVPVRKGLLDVLLGSTTPLDLPFDTDYWLEIEVEDDILLPRVRFTSSPYAIRCETADSLATGGGGSDNDWAYDTGTGLTGAIYHTGNVGIGSDTPDNKLEVRGDVSIIGAASGINPLVWIQNTDDGTAIYGEGQRNGISGVTYSDNTIQGAVRGASFGNAPGILGVAGSGLAGKFTGEVSISNALGIGTENPLQHLHLVGDDTLCNLLVAPNEDISGGNSQILLAEDDDNTYGMVLKYDGDSNKLGFYGKSTVAIYGPHLSMNRDDGRIGIGTDNPGSHRLYIYSTGTGVGGSTVYVKNDRGDSTGIAMGLETTSNDLTLLLTQKGRGDIFRCDSYVDGWHSVFKVENNGKTTCSVLRLTGGSDIAEPFDVDTRDEIKPGMVLTIDPQSPGKLKISQNPYDRCVAGVVSGAGGIQPGMVMGQEGTVADGECPVALSGRVYCLADASQEPIKPGDLLTTSNKPGHAMKVNDFYKAQGAIIGKAMTPLDEGQGMVLVLVSLQ